MGKKKTFSVGTWLVLAAIIALIGLPFFRVWWVSRLPHATVTCIYLAMFDQWLIDKNETSYPNVEGDGRRSYVACHSIYVKGKPRDIDSYIPGLCGSDPPEMIIMYMNRKAVSRKHGDRSQWLPKMKWMVLPHKWEDAHDECGEWLETPEFKQRIRATLEYVKKEKRPNWETIVKQHETFLETVKE